MSEVDWPVIDQSDWTTRPPYFRRYPDGRIVRVVDDTALGSKFVDQVGSAGEVAGAALPDSQHQRLIALFKEMGLEPELVIDAFWSVELEDPDNSGRCVSFEFNRDGTFSHLEWG